MLQKLPVTVLNRMWSRSMSRLCSNQINVSKAEVKAFRQILARSGIQANARFLQNLSGFQGSQVSQVISRNFSTTPQFRQNDGRNNKDDDDGKLISRKKLPLASVKRFHEFFYDFFHRFRTREKNVNVENNHNHWLDGILGFHFDTKSQCCWTRFE